MKKQLPIREILPTLLKTLRTQSRAVLSAPPGAGKTTAVPVALLGEPWLDDKKILMLEPRRMAARSAARYMAAGLGETVGETAGYRIRMESRISPRTRIEVVTEGVFTRLIQSDPALEAYGAILFDEFHERSLSSDLGMAFCMQTQEVLREDLRMIVMSATLDIEPILTWFSGAPLIQSEGRSFDVRTHYLEAPLAAVHMIRKALAEEKEGDLLVFLPGAAEIRRTAEHLREDAAHDGKLLIAPLYGSLSNEAQDRALAPAPAGRRKVVLSTSIAETSLTVEGVRIVIDSGYMRVPRFSPRTGLSRLVTVPVSLAAAEQRRGRAGRTQPGVCYRMWTEQEERRLVPHHVPEITQADLAPLALELAAWGTGDPSALRWLDPPPAAAYQQAREQLALLGALDAAGRLTPHGRRMAELGTHPRLAHMLLRAARIGLGGTAALLTALLSSRDPLRRADRPGRPGADMRLRLAALQGAVPAGCTADGPALQRMRAEAARWRRDLGVPRGERVEEAACGLLLAFAYPDRIAQRRTDGRYLLSSGRGAVLAAGQTLAVAPYLAAAELEDSGVDSRLDTAAPVHLSELEQHFAEQLRTEETVEWDESVLAVRGRSKRLLGALVLKERPLQDLDSERVLEVMLGAIAKKGLSVLPWTKSARRLQERMAYLYRWLPECPDVTEAGMLASLSSWMGPHIYGLKSLREVQSLKLTSLLEGMLTWEQRPRLEEWAPSHIQVPSGTRIPIDYSDPDAPVLAARIQQCFGLRETPRIAGGQQPLTMHLLSPAQRPVQITTDLESFWEETYHEVKKDLKGRYPKHSWPDDPWKAKATNRVKPRE